MNSRDSSFPSIRIITEEAEQILSDLYGLSGKITPLPGEIDFNFHINSTEGNFVLKVMRPGTDPGSLQFRQSILNHFKENSPGFVFPESFPDREGNEIPEIVDREGRKRSVLLLSWISGRVWSSVNPVSDSLLTSLGQQAGAITASLQGFNHPYASRELEWDIAQGEWTVEHTGLFSGEQKRIVTFFQQRFMDIRDQYQNCRESVVHNDANDNNVIVSDNLLHPEVVAIIDYGDSVFTRTINDLAFLLAYSMMGKPDPLGAALHAVRGYHSRFPLKEEELKFLYVLTAMRLVISVTKSAVNRQKEPDNDYLQVSDKAAWDLLEKWIGINESLACFSFRHACGFTPHPDENLFSNWAEKHQIRLNTLFPNPEFSVVVPPDMGIGSSWLGHEEEYLDNEFLAQKIDQLRNQEKNTLFAGGYLETRPFYCTPAYEREGNSGREYRSTHLGLDVWTPAETPIHSILKGKVFSVHNNDNEKDYGPTLILEHQTEGGEIFYTLYGHMTPSSLKLHKTGNEVSKGDLIGHVGDVNENGNWAPHLHFQLILDMLDFETDFPGVAYPGEIEVWQSISPDPNLLFRENGLKRVETTPADELIRFRKDHLGKSLSLSYEKPLNIVRGSGVYLFDRCGRKYLDTVNNVAHVGHENYRVVKAGRDQMAVLNTNTRYLHKNINRFAEELLSTFPEELSVAHFVNSGSEANELAMRMAYAATGAKDIIAVEVGYHGNTNGCINISSYKFNGKGGTGAPKHTHVVPLPDRFRGIYRGNDTGARYAAHLSDQIELIRSKGRKPAAFICESIISCGGQIELPEDYLRIAYEIVRDAGGICIADEVQVGCGRVGKEFWGFQLHDVVPDIVTIGKPIGNGHPLAAVVCRPEIANAFSNGMEYFNTFGGNPVSCAIGLEVLRTIREDKLRENALETGEYLKGILRELQGEFPVIGDVRGQGLFLGFELADENLNPLTEKTSYLSNRMKDFGILTSIDGKDNNVIKIKPPMVFSKNDADYFTEKLRQVFSENYMTT